MMVRSRVLPVFTLAALATPAAAQAPQLLPYPRTQDLLVVDSTYDGVWRFADRNQDGDFNDPGEITTYYDDVAGSIVLTNPTCIVVAPNGTAYVGDSTVDIIMALDDLDGDGNALGIGEHRVFFDGSNAGGIVMASVQGITIDAAGRLFLAVSNAGTTGTDMILMLVDLNGDGDANDLFEAVEYCTIPGGAGSVGNSIPTKVVVAPDGNLYYAEVGSTGVVTKGVWKLTDLNHDGDCNDAGEVTLFWTPPFAASPFYWGLAVDDAGNFYVTDHSTNESIWRGRDVDGSGVIDPAEQTLFYQTPNSTWWDVVLREDGTVLVCEAFTPDRLTALLDLNHDGDALDANEAHEAYDATVSGAAVLPRGAAFVRAPLLAAAPDIVPIGQSTSLVASASKPGDLTLVVISVGLAAPFPLPPFGLVEVDIGNFHSVGLGFANAAGEFTVPLAIPNNPVAINTYAFQALSGDAFRLFLSNAVSLTVTP
ncbi:MAG TPA: hypothetical protein VFZ65_20210 [Planctomycetota bacterium]|nr:hypothetical protein [Planctomycetota bacterium]